MVGPVMVNRSCSTFRLAAVLLSLTGAATTASVASATASPGTHSRVKATTSLGAKADLALRTLDVEFGDAQFEVTGRVANTGSKRAKRSDLVVALSDDERLSDDDDVLGDISLKGIKPGKSRGIDSAIDLPSDDQLSAGIVYLLVCADGYGVVRETNEGNNCVSEVIADATDDSSSAGDDGSGSSGAGVTETPGAGDDAGADDGGSASPAAAGDGSSDDA